jgi:hypothetical protein
MCGRSWSSACLDQQAGGFDHVLDHVGIVVAGVGQPSKVSMSRILPIIEPHQIAQRIVAVGGVRCRIAGHVDRAAGSSSRNRSSLQRFQSSGVTMEALM